MFTRIYFDRALTEGASVTLSQNAIAHLRARRIKPGSKLTLFNGLGGEYECEITTMARRDIQVDVQQHSDVERELTRNLHLGQAIINAQKFALIVQKAVELGVQRITPIITERVQAGAHDKRLEHWQNIIISACEQCGRNRLPVIVSPVSLHDWCASLTETSKIMFAPGAASTNDDVSSNDIACLVGPEGGFSETDLAVCEQASLQPLSLGPTILRAETAAIAGLARLR